MGRRTDWTSSSTDETRRFSGKVYQHTGRNFKRKIDAKRYSEELRKQGLRARVVKNQKTEGFHGGKYAVYSKESYHGMAGNQLETVERYRIKKEKTPRKQSDFEGVEIWFSKHFSNQQAVRHDWMFNVKSLEMSDLVKDDLEWNLRQRGLWYENVEREGPPSYYCVLNKLQVYCAVKDLGKLIVTTTYPYSKGFQHKMRSLPKITFANI
jgi:hypothetical protein